MFEFETYAVFKMLLYGLTFVVAAIMILGSNEGEKSLVFQQPIITSTAVVDKNVNITRVQQISLLGERNSGTRWVYEHLADCFGHSIEVKRDLTRYKHWFQYYNRSRYHGDRHGETLVIAQFRNPYEWVEAMRKHPHHAPNHMNLSWSNFIKKEWTMDRFGLDLQISDMKNRVCQQKFRYRDVVSCVEEPPPIESYGNRTLRWSEHRPFYEMRNDGSGRPYKNILGLRSAKIRHLVSIAEWKGIHNVWKIQYEYLLEHGTRDLLDRIVEQTGIQYSCQPHPKQTRRKRLLHRNMIQYINKHLDWDTENLVGYFINNKTCTKDDIENCNNENTNRRTTNRWRWRR